MDNGAYIVHVIWLDGREQRIHGFADMDAVSRWIDRHYQMYRFVEAYREEESNHGQTGSDLEGRGGHHAGGPEKGV
ncbi:MAG: hypothetical protein J5556_07100 [Deltaproteobacteria bacterium]|nr:hypothetical protein [Deltaproteobacteria bacterium]